MKRALKVFHVEQVVQLATLLLAGAMGTGHSERTAGEDPGPGASLATSNHPVPQSREDPMVMEIRMPKDVRNLPSFRSLRELAGGEETALFIWAAVWCELGYRLEEGGCAGRLAAADVPMVLRALEGDGAKPAPDQVGVSNPKAQARLDACVAAKFLTRDGDDYVCPRFAVLHGGEGMGRSVAQRGGDMRAYNLRMRKSHGEAFQQSLLIHENKLVDGDGQPLPPETVRRVMRLIVACDNALFRENRPPFGYTEGLIQDGLAVLKRFNDEEIDHVCRTVAKNRNHPALSGMTAERLLPVFGEVAGRVET